MNKKRILILNYVVMKKNLFLLGLAVAAMTSCTNDEVVEMQQPTQKAIGFETFVNKGTRAITTTDAPAIKKDENGTDVISGLQRFYTFGYYKANELVFDNILVYNSIKTENNTSNIIWNYAEKKYWTRNTYQFGAYANGNSETSSLAAEFGESNNTVNLTIKDYEVKDANDLVADIVTIDNSNLGSPIVGFTFKHMLSKVKFTIKNTDSQYKMKIVSALVINGAMKKGNCVVSKDPNANKTSLTNVVWSATTGETAATYKPFFKSVSGEGNNNSTIIQSGDNIGTSNDYIAKEGYVESEEFLVMPQNLANVTYSVTVKFYDNDNQEVRTKTLTGKPVLSHNNDTGAHVWNYNTVYHYTIGLPTSAQPIEFGNIGVSGWYDPQEVTLPVTADEGNNN